MGKLLSSAVRINTVERSDRRLLCSYDLSLRSSHGSSDIRLGLYLKTHPDLIKPMTLIGGSDQVLSVV
jgi:hypothetical protein